jgi:ABC-type bacteriocin/lantibiotic exporter with double-glycine peptidase domain
MTPIERFRRLLKIDKKDITQVYAYAFFNGIVNLSLPLGIQAIINLIQGGEMTTSWVILVAFVIGGIALTGVLQLLQLRIVENIAQKIFSKASFEFAYRIPRIKFSAFYNYYAPELTNRFFDTMTIQKGLPKILIDFSLALFQIFVGLIVLSLYHNFFILFSFILGLLLYVIIAITGPKGMSTSLTESKYKYNIAFWLEEIARTKLSFKLYSSSDLNLDKSNEHVDKYLTARENHFGVLVNQFLYLIGFKVIIAAGLLVTGSILVFNQEMNIGQFVAAEIIIILIIASVEKLIGSLDSIYDVLTALEKIGYVTDMPLDNEGGLALSTEDPFSVAFKNVSYAYPDNTELTLDKVSFQVPSGKSVYIDGPSGAGKSTILNLIAGVEKPQSGTILFNGQSFQSLCNKRLHENIGFVLSHNDIFQGTILENITMGRANATMELVNRAIKITRLEDFISTLPNGLSTILDPEGKKIPRGIQDKILLARAIATDPLLLILEDPLDRVRTDEKQEIMKDLTSPECNWTIIITSVDANWKKLIRDTITLNEGKIVNSTLKNSNDA